MLHAYTGMCGNVAQNFAVFLCTQTHARQDIGPPCAKNSPILNRGTRKEESSAPVQDFLLLTVKLVSLPNLRILVIIHSDIFRNLN
jgi:hypothetical protein